MNIQGAQIVLSGLALVGSGCLIAFVVWVMRARGIDLVNRKGSQAWESVAEAYEKRIAQLEAALKEMDVKLTGTLADSIAAKALNGELVKLNLQLQTTNSAQAEEISRLRGRVTELEREVTELRGAGRAGQ